MAKKTTRSTLKMDNELIEVTQKVKRELTDFMGIDMEDIEPETDLREDLHMTATELTDFMEILKSSGLDTTKLDLTQIETFDDLTEALTSHI